MKILLSPAKSIDTERSLEVPFTTTALFLEDAQYLVNKLKKLSANQLTKMMHISKDLGEINYERFQQWEQPTALQNGVVPTVTAFTGEVYRGLDVTTFTDEDYNYAQNSLRILSGLYGILRPLDLLYPYRLEMGTSWKVTPKTTNLYKYWGTRLAQSLNNEMIEGEDIINLASSEYFKAIDAKTLKARMITPVFKEFKNGEYKVVMTYAKNARGVMARYIIKNKLQNSEDLKLFNESNYSFDAKQSSENEWVFVR